MRLDTDDNKIDVRSGDSTARENLHVPNRVEARASYLALAASFFSMFCVVGLALWGLPFYYDFMVREFGWTRAQVTSGNALSKLVVGPVFGFIAGWVVDRFGPRRLMIVGILVAGLALVGLGSISTLSWFYFFLPAQRARLRLRRTASVTGAHLATLRGIPGKSHGARLPGNWIRGSCRSVDHLVSLHASRLARIVARTRRHHDRYRTPVCARGERNASN